jgi:hypothetical protein
MWIVLFVSVLLRFALPDGNKCQRRFFFLFIRLSLLIQGPEEITRSTGVNDRNSEIYFAFEIISWFFY